MNEFIRLTEKQ